ncbi:hypothetical protein HPB47_015811 [Ixodes persulcatus]|uniref:Uncharacterized protein n=1 Tax=Ixodes persulcatus TaxID=34615 RepID=A0AC60QSH2_IXOPE|nr:hypothetical protein HPB47_015811 [Ixodes persulcatus]
MREANPGPARNGGEASPCVVGRGEEICLAWVALAMLLGTIVIHEHRDVRRHETKPQSGHPTEASGLLFCRQRQQAGGAPEPRGMPFLACCRHTCDYRQASLRDSRWKDAPSAPADAKGENGQGTADAQRENGRGAPYVQCENGNVEEPEAITICRLSSFSLEGYRWSRRSESLYVEFSSKAVPLLDRALGRGWAARGQIYPPEYRAELCADYEQVKRAVLDKLQLAPPEYRECFDSTSKRRDKN